MKANELMIGDWVRSSFYHTPVQIQAIKLSSYEYGWISCTVDRRAPYREDFKSDASLSPIPLTAEILEKNGFVQQPFFVDSKGDALSDDFCKNLPNLQVCVELDKYEPRFMVFHRDYQADDELDDNPTYCMVATWVLPLGESVHELQHALHLCGLYELAENFKI